MRKLIGVSLNRLIYSNLSNKCFKKIQTKEIQFLA